MAGRAGTPLLRDTSLAALRAYDLGRDRPGSAGARCYPDRIGLDGVTMPTLPELPELLAALADASGPRRKIFIEVMTDPVGDRESADPVALLDACLRDLAAAGRLDDAKIIAFDWEIQAHGGQEWSPHIVDVTPERVADAHALGQRVGVWGVASAEQIAAMTALGAEVLTVSGPAWSAPSISG